MSKPDDSTEVDSMGSIHRSFLPYVDIHTVAHPETDFVPYLRWELKKDPKSQEDIWLSVLPVSTAVRETFKENQKVLVLRLNPAFVEARNGFYFGRWMHGLCNRPARANGFFIQVYGNR